MQNLFIAVAAFFLIFMYTPDNEKEGIVDIVTVDYDTVPMFHEFEYTSDSSLDDIIYRVDTIKEKVKAANNELALLDKEWFPYRGLEYSYSPLEYDSLELLIFTNIIYRESGSAVKNYTSEALNDAMDVDRYLVALVALRTIHSDIPPFDKINTLSDVFDTKQFPYEKTSRVLKNKEWEECKKVAKKVLSCNIPSYVPYIPKGTFCYWNTRIDTNLKQKKYLETKGVHVASSVKDHHYFAILEYMDEEELQMIKNSPCSNTTIQGEKTIKAGILCKKYLK